MTRALRQKIEEQLFGPGARLDTIDNLPADNPGLMLTHYLLNQKRSDPPSPGTPARTRLISGIAARAKWSTEYQRAYERWKDAVSGLPGAVQQRAFRVQGRMIVGYGAESVLEASIALNQPWGMPYIPGTALKGLAAHYLQGVLASGDASLMRAPDLDPTTNKPTGLNAHGVLFGTQRDAAYITWHDAWLVPERTNQHPLCLDVITTHHPGYYQERGHKEPTDFDDPTPISFVSARGAYLICLQGPSDAWVNLAFNVLTAALANAGIGAKTAAGYGRLTSVTPV